jgi:acyl-CoA synthetase (AMP-forming)/AMP-acid ligase II
VDRSSRANSKRGFVGRCWGGKVAVLQEDGSIAEHGEGELLLRSPAMMRGYLADPERTKAVMLKGWLRTGDRGSVSRHGEIHLKGRLVDDINVEGVNIYPASVDDVLPTHQAVLDVCCFPVVDKLYGERVAAAVVLYEPGSVTARELAEYPTARVRKEAVPTVWRFVDALPTNERGKVVRRRLAEQLGIEAG